MVRNYENLVLGQNKLNSKQHDIIVKVTRPPRGIFNIRLLHEAPGRVCDLTGPGPADFDKGLGGGRWRDILSSFVSHRSCIVRL